MQEKRFGFDGIFCSFDLPFKKIPNGKKNFDHEKVFVPFPGTFSNEQKESKNHINQFYNHISEIFESYKSK